MLTSKRIYLDRIHSEIANHSRDSDYVMLEAAVGAGISGMAIAQSLCDDHHMVAIDINQKNLDHLADRLRQEGLTVRPDFVCSDVRDMSSFTNECFNLICSDTTINMLGHEFFLGLKEFYRTLRPDGVLFIRETCAPAVEMETARDLFFKVISSARILLPDPYVMLPVNLITFALGAIGFSDIKFDHFKATYEADDVKELTNWHPLCRSDFAMRDAFVAYYLENLSMFASPATSIAASYIIECKKPT